MMLLRDVTKQMPVAEVAEVEEEGKGEVMVILMVILMEVVCQVTDMVKPRVVVLGQACVKVQAVAPLPAPALAPNHHNGVPALALAPWRHLDLRVKLFAS
jgi:hypothetical protein